MINPNISIITINYNNAKGLEDTMQSVGKQSYLDVEFIIIDGDSTDTSVSVIKNNIKSVDYWVSAPDKGIYDAMNKGIKKSTGNFLLFLNSGDIFTSNGALFDFVNHSNFRGDIIYGDYQFENGEKIYPDHLTPFYFLRTSLPHQSTFFKRSVFEIMGLYNEKYQISADRAFYIQCYLSNKFHFQHVNYKLTLFDLNGKSNDLAWHKMKTEEDTEMLKELYGGFYEDYLEFRKLQIEVSQLKRNSFKGLIKRIKNKLKIK